MGYFEECLKTSSKELRRGGVFGKKFKVSIRIYERHIAGEAFNVLDDQELTFAEYDIPYERIKSVSVGTVEGDKCVFVDYKKDAVVASYISRIVIIGLDDLDDIAGAIQEARDKRLESINSEKEKVLMAAKKHEEEALMKEKDASDFYKGCYDFHIKSETPVHTFSSDKNQIVAMYIDSERGLNFLAINGYRKEETVGHIPFDKIHYYEKAGNVSYTTDIHGSYSSFGGSMTGGSFSKFAAGLGGVLFGFMGMAAGALFSYEPAKQEPINTSFKLDSEVIKIDDRNVILNFYSDEKKQYIDIELPQDTYNFLQTYLPEKK